MTHYYILIIADAQIDAATRVYRVAVSQSRQGDRDFLYLVAYAAEHGYFFELYTADIERFLERIGASIYGADDPRPYHGITLRLATARAMVATLREAEKTISLQILRKSYTNANCNR